MQRDFSPTYYFRVMRAEQLLALYRCDPNAFVALSNAYKSEFVAAGRAPHRLSVWLKRDDIVFQSCDDIRLDTGRRLVRAFERPEYYGYALNRCARCPGQHRVLFPGFPSRRWNTGIHRLRNAAAA